MRLCLQNSHQLSTLSVILLTLDKTLYQFNNILVFEKMQLSRDGQRAFCYHRSLLRGQRKCQAGKVPPQRAEYLFRTLRVPVRDSSPSPLLKSEVYRQREPDTMPRSL